MKSIIRAAIFAVTVIVPAASFAQSADHTTRSQVRAELVQLENAGYHVGDGDQAHYPDAIQAAEAKLASQNTASNSYGGVASGSSQSGTRVSTADWNAMYSR